MDQEKTIFFLSFCWIWIASLSMFSFPMSPTSYTIPGSFSLVVQKDLKQNLSPGISFSHSFIFVSKFSWSICECRHATVALYMWFRTSMLVGKKLLFVISGSCLPAKSSFLTKNWRCRSISDTRFTPQETRSCILLTKLSSMGCRSQAAWWKSFIIYYYHYY